MAGPKVIIVGGGLAGLAATIKVAEMGLPVDLFSIVPVRRSHSVCAQGGINAAVNTKGEGDSPQIHFDDTVYGGDFLANQSIVKDMCEKGPGIIFMLDRMGVMFNRTPEGNLDFRRFGGTLHHRTAYAGATTGQQLLYALDEQVRRQEVEGKVNKYENWEFLSAALDDDGACRGIVAMDMKSMEIKAFPADAVILATGGPGLIFGRSTCPNRSEVRAGASGPTRKASPGTFSKRCTPPMATSSPATSPPAPYSTYACARSLGWMARTRSTSTYPTSTPTCSK
jgi:succinate dehydrogenase / fumarate reductase flavoprotein subunit